MKKGGFVLIEVVMSFFLISLLGTLIIMVYIQTIEKYDNIREERKAYVLVSNIHEQFIANPEKFLNDSIRPDSPHEMRYDENEDGGVGVGFHHYDEFLRVCGRNERFMYRVFLEINYDKNNEVYSLYISEVERKGEIVVSDIRLGKMRA